MRTPLLPAYAELQCFSNFTFLHGASHAEELVARAKQLGYAALAITDECSLAGVVRAHCAARDNALPLLIGASFQLTETDGSPGPAITLLAQDRTGYGNLSELITLARMRAPKGQYRLHPDDLERPAAPYLHLRWLPHCLAILSAPAPLDARRLDTQARWLQRTFFGRAWLGLTLHGGPHDEAQREAIETVAARYRLPVAALGGVRMHVRSRKPLQDVLSAIRLRQPVSDCGYALAPNAEQHLRSRLRLATLYPAAALAETVSIAARCHFSLENLRYEYPEELVPPGVAPADYLRQETYAGAHRRFPQGIPYAVQQQLEYELDLIADLRYEPYFLTVYDLVRFARNEGILCQGRGSAANSAVCYCLGVTEVDPARSNLLFERFISRERNEPPDIDVDFEHQRREEVIQYIYRKYGRDRAALAAAVASYRPRSALRDAGKALGVDALLVERVVRTHHWFDSSTDLLARFREAGLDTNSSLITQWARLAAQLLGFPRHLSQHSGGFVISAGKLSRLVPIENAAMPERSVIEWDKDDLDAIGLLKVDVLALGMLSAIRRTLALVAQRRGRAFDLQDIPAEDPATYAMIRRADTIGVFQIESRAQMSMLPRLRPEQFYDLVIEVAIVRPGPVQGGMVHPYLRRRQGLEPVSYPSAEVRSALERTLGVPIFQEQVMQVAMLAAGFSAGEADQLRRAMAAWRRKGGLQHYYTRIVDGMLARGYERAFAESIFAQIQGFGEYGFPESHAASFALLVYASAWLKCHEPAAFLCAMLNSQPMGFYSASQLVQDAQRHGVEVRPVDVTISGWDATLEDDLIDALAESDSDRPTGAARTDRSEIDAPRANAATDADADTADRDDGSSTQYRYGGNRDQRRHHFPHHGHHGDDDRNTYSSSSSSSGNSNSSETTRSKEEIVPTHRTHADAPHTAHAARDGHRRQSAHAGPSVRLGLSQVRGLSDEVAWRIEAARAVRPFDDVADLARRAGLDRRALQCLAAAGALQALAGHRRQALWQAVAAAHEKDLLEDASRDDASAPLAAPSEGEEIVGDYRSLGLTLGRHPLALLRRTLLRRRLMPASVLMTYGNGRPARGCGIVTIRQRPGTAKGVMFVTIEDETGPVNVIVWPALLERYRKVALGASLLAVYGVWQCEGKVRHLVARRLEDLSSLLGALPAPSRDFF